MSKKYKQLIDSPEYPKGTIAQLSIPPVLNEDIALSIISSHKEDLDLIFNVGVSQ